MILCKCQPNVILQIVHGIFMHLDFQMVVPSRSKSMRKITVVEKVT
jgi:hypothetical protein